MANTLNNTTTITDDAELTFGTSSDFKIKYDSTSGLLEFLDSADNVLLTLSDDGTAGTLDVSGPITGDFTNNGGTGSTEAIAAGNYTPTIREGSNVASSTASRVHWQRIGGIVSMGGKVTITPTADATTTRFGIQIPVSSNFVGDDDDANGMGVADVGGVVAYGKANASSDDVQYEFTSSGTGAHEFRFWAIYEVQ